jgi:hypothetical protein
MVFLSLLGVFPPGASMSAATPMSTTSTVCRVSGSSRYLALGDLVLLGLAPWFLALGDLAWGGGGHAACGGQCSYLVPRRGVAVLDIATWGVRWGAVVFPQLLGAVEAPNVTHGETLAA